MPSIIKVDQIQSDQGFVNVSSNLQFSSGFTMLSPTLSSPTLTTPTTSGILTLGAGIKFPATQVSSADANTLDDYEEGTWTPQLGSDSTQPTVSYGSQSGVYTKIGNTVYVELCLTWASISGGTGGATIKNLPFTPGYVTVDPRGFTYMFAWSGPSYTGQLATIPDAGVNHVLIYYNNNGSIGSQSISSMGTSGGNIRCRFSYIVTN
jgi:hypothetical protein